MTKAKTCVVCERQKGCTKDRFGMEDGIPLGAITECGTCHRMACPDCLHEVDCCFMEKDEHVGDPTWSPPGWRVAEADEQGRVVYDRIA